MPSKKDDPLDLAMLDPTFIDKVTEEKSSKPTNKDRLAIEQKKEERLSMKEKRLQGQTAPASTSSAAAAVEAAPAAMIRVGLYFRAVLYKVYNTCIIHVLYTLSFGDTCILPLQPPPPHPKPPGLTRPRLGEM